MTSVLAVVTHFACEHWLARCLDSLVAQRRAPDGIVVVDDASPRPPVDIVERFPGVALLVAAENVGPYRLLEQVVRDTRYTAYLLQDADDWSTPDRLARLLGAAQRKRAGLVGCQVESVFEGVAAEPESRYPLDCNAAVLADPVAHPLLLSAGLVSRDLVERLGGFAAGLRFGGDSEFIRRAIHLSPVINIRERCYFRRVHPAAATRRPESGYGSPLRLAIQRRNHERSRANVERAGRGEPPDLSPIATAPPIALAQVLGPSLR